MTYSQNDKISVIPFHKHDMVSPVRVFNLRLSETHLAYLKEYLRIFYLTN